MGNGFSPEMNCLKVWPYFDLYLTWPSRFEFYIIMYYAIHPSTGSSKVSFAIVCIERIEKMFCSELTDEIAQIETYKTASELRSVQGSTNHSRYWNLSGSCNVILGRFRGGLGPVSWSLDQYYWNFTLMWKTMMSWLFFIFD